MTAFLQFIVCLLASAAIFQIGREQGYREGLSDGWKYRQDRMRGGK